MCDDTVWIKSATLLRGDKRCRTNNLISAIKNFQGKTKDGGGHIYKAKGTFLKSCISTDYKR